MLFSSAVTVLNFIQYNNIRNLSTYIAMTKKVLFQKQAEIEVAS